MKKCKKRHKKKLKKSASYIQSIVNMFLIKYNHNRLYHLISFFDLLSPPLSFQKSFVKMIEIVETKFEFQTHDLGKLLQLKT